MLRHVPLRLYWHLKGKLLWRWRRATLGDTRANAVVRYGKPVKVWSEDYSYYPESEFVWRESTVTVIFVDEIAAMAWVSSDKQIPEDVRAELFSIHSCGLRWCEQKNPGRHVTKHFAYIPDIRGNRYFEREDKRAWACLATSGVGMHDRQFHMDFTCTRWQEVKESKFGVWTTKLELSRAALRNQSGQQPVDP
jgi:hypothetical protein